jgi:biotin carboxyl carrier protein
MGNEQALKLTVDGKTYDVVVDLTAAPIRVVVDGREFLVEVAAEASPGTEPRAAAVARTPAAPPSARRSPAPAAPGGSAAASGSTVVSPMPGSIVSIRVRPGQRVERGEILCSLEAMKMNNAIHAPRAGTIKDVAVTEGQAVAYRQVLVTYAD